MNFSLSSCSHVLSNRKQSTMSKRSSGRRTDEGPVVSESRSACLVSRNLSADRTLWIRVLHTARRIKSWVKILFSQAQGNLWDRVQNSAMNSRERQRDDNPCSTSTGGEVCVSVQAQGNLCEVSRNNLQGRSRTATICISPTNDSLGRSSKIFDRN